MKIRPLDDRIMVKPLEAETKTKGGIVLPDAAKEKPQKGEIISVGDGKLLDDGKRAKMLLKKGDHVIYGKFSGNEIKVNDKDYIIMREDEVLAQVD